MQVYGFSIIGSVLAFIEFAVLIVLVIISLNLISHNKKFQKHKKKIKKLQQKYNQSAKLPSARIRIFLVVMSTILSSALGWLIYGKWEIINKIIADTPSIISITTLVITAPVAFTIWIFRDKNKLLELENTRKDTNLKEFQQLQRWATGNIEGDKGNQDNIEGDKGNQDNIALQISALHSLRAYLKGEYGESFRRGAYEIFRASLATQHQKILQQINNVELETTIVDEINRCPLTEQLNIIVSEEWFNLLINHNFPTSNISLLGVDLHDTYLHHRTYGKMLDLQNAQLQGADLQKAQLQGVNLQGAQLQGVNLQGAQLQGADLQKAQLLGANLRKTQLQGANLRKTQLQGADLRDTQLQGADLTGVELQGAELWRAKLHDGCINNHHALIEGLEEQYKKQYKTFEATTKSNLINKLKTVNNMWAKEVIERIELASEKLDLSKAITGKYNKKEARKWIKGYKNATNANS